MPPSAPRTAAAPKRISRPGTLVSRGIAMLDRLIVSSLLADSRTMTPPRWHANKTFAAENLPRSCARQPVVLNLNCVSVHLPAGVGAEGRIRILASHVGAGDRF